MPHNSSDQNSLAAASAFIAAMGAYEDDFIAYGLTDEFLGDLQNDINAFEQNLDVPAKARETHVAATAEIGAVVRRGMIAVRILDGVVKNKYLNNVGKLAAWTTASHIERTPKSKEPTAPTP